MTSIYKKGNRTCAITYKNGLMKIEYKTDGKTDIIITCNSSEKIESVNNSKLFNLTY